MDTTQRILNDYEAGLQLLPRLEEAFNQYDVPSELRDAIIQEAPSQFAVFRDNTIMPLKAHGSIVGYVQDYLAAHLTDDIRAKVKQDKAYAQLVEAAKSGDMKRYRACRAEFSGR